MTQQQHDTPLGLSRGPKDPIPKTALHRNSGVGNLRPQTFVLHDTFVEHIGFVSTAVCRLRLPITLCTTRNWGTGIFNRRSSSPRQCGCLTSSQFTLNILRNLLILLPKSQAKNAMASAHSSNESNFIIVGAKHWAEREIVIFCSCGCPLHETPKPRRDT